MARLRRQEVADRARARCEYCQLPQALTTLPHEIDHIRARKHRGPDTLQNTCWACAGCNASKGTNVAGYDPETDELVQLFSPRRDEWDEHFFWDGPEMRGRTPIGRATIEVLRINDPERIEHRRLLVAAGLFPPR